MQQRNISARKNHSLIGRHTCVFAVAVGIILFLFTSVSCMTMADYDFSTVDRYTAYGQFTKAAGILTQDTKRVYTEHDKVLELLDHGMLLQYAGNSVGSTELLSQAEQKIYEYYSKSISQGISSYIANDTVIDYAGDTYEDIYTNIFMALNYIDRNDIENAMVEIRRFDNKLKDITANYQTRLAQLQQQVADGQNIKTADIEFHNSALARYLSMLLYRSKNEYDSAAVDLRLIKSAYISQGDLYNFSMPSSLDDELLSVKGKTRLNLIAFSGRAPVKKEVVVRVAAPSGFYYKIAFPEMIKRDSTVARIQFTAKNLETEQTYTVQAEQIESIENIALDTFQQKQALVYGKALVRSLLKSTPTAVFDEMSHKTSNRDERDMYQMLGLISSVATEFSERADVRTSRYFPARASVAGITLDPGTYTLSVNYYGSNGTLVAAQRAEQFVIAADKLNLVESVCLR